ncbi:hypothetical protein ILUMI_16202, partial [Ignelater luminosus]
MTSPSPIPATTKPNPTQCYNCNLPGHYVSYCTKPGRLRETNKSREQEPNTAAGGTTFLVGKEEIRSAYLVPIKLKFNTNKDNLYVLVNACLDTGSPISLIKSSVLPPESYVKSYISENTMKYPSLSGRDFIRSQNLEILISQECKIKRKSDELQNEAQSLISIDIGDVQNSAPGLNINKELDYEVRKKDIAV